jgi:hypothetical protein
MRNVVIADVQGRGVCPEGEPRLKRALEDSALVVVNGVMAVKLHGDTIGVALEEVDVPGGKLEFGRWYGIDCGRDESWRRHVIQNAFFRGDTHVDLPGTTRWFGMRAIDAYRVCEGPSEVDCVQTAVANLQLDTPMPGGVSREEYFRTYNDRS